ncbi:hypothetical protein [Actinoalloteichus sp. GBA129-24]|uniref:hypothetical protein n=1 Tax=Actinoalloteichus sp. GBA129-24 TaxID=1612551 RepID=UPI00095036E4|nr:hypothetical protein [Actinoalloteichus sp. GBA129-24]APU18469.1 hypothetical protein UA75_02150 [Actinoalloteichus sp. GBA129-24]
MVAETAIGEGREIFDQGTAGSVWPQVPEMRRLGAEAGDDVRLAHTAIVQAQDIIDGYCISIAGHGIGAGDTTITRSIAAIYQDRLVRDDAGYARRIGRWERGEQQSQPWQRFDRTGRRGLIPSRRLCTLGAEP